MNRRALPQSSTWKVAFRRRFEAQGDTPARIARGPNQIPDIPNFQERIHGVHLLETIQSCEQREVYLVGHVIPSELHRHGILENQMTFDSDR
jgi:hypothetical protein